MQMLWNLVHNPAYCRHEACVVVSASSLHFDLFNQEQFAAVSRHLSRAQFLFPAVSRRNKTSLKGFLD